MKIKIRFGLIPSGLTLALLACLTVSAEPKELTDPTRPLGFVIIGNEVQSDLVLTSTMINSNRRVAVINGERIEENQKFGNAQALKILPGRVILRIGDHRQELKLHNTKIKQPTQQ